MLISFQHEYGRKILQDAHRKVKRKSQSPQFLHKSNICILKLPFTDVLLPLTHGPGTQALDLLLCR